MTSDKVVITKQDLRDPRLDDFLALEQAARRPLSAAERAPAETGLLLNPMFYTGLAGIIGAVVAWMIVEPMIIKAPGDEDGIGLLLMLPVASALIGLAVGVIEGAMSRNPGKALRCGAIGFGVGLAWGVVGIFLAGIVFQSVLALGATLFLAHRGAKYEDLGLGGLFFMMMSARAIAWTFIGAGMGLGQGIALASRKLFMNGMVGGLLGGFLGGILFDPIALSCMKLVPRSLISPGSLSRVIGLSVIGLLIGVLIGLVESLSKEAWFIMKTGPLRGKQFIFYNNPMIIGSSPKCDIYIFKDAAIEPRHAEVFQIGAKFELRDRNSPQGIFVNGRQVRTRVLEKGDIVVIGQSILEFDQRLKNT